MAQYQPAQRNKMAPKIKPNDSKELKRLVDSKAIYLGDIDVGLITDFGAIFLNSDRSDFSGIESWDVSNATNMEYMFANAVNFNEPIGKWNVSNVLDMSSMFEGAINFNQDISRWRVENVYDMSSMFKNASSFKQNLSSWAAVRLKHKDEMFAGCPINLKDEVKKKEFRPTNKMELKRIVEDLDVDLSNISVDLITDFSKLFKNSQREDFRGIEQWNMSGAKDLSYMFEGAQNFNEDLSRWDTGRVTNMQGIFKDATRFNKNISGWDVSSVRTLKEAFEGASSFNQPLNGWDIGNVEELSFIFADAKSFNQPLDKWDTSKVVNMYRAFARASSFNQDISMWNMGSLYAKNYMFQECDIDERYLPSESGDDKKSISGGVLEKSRKIFGFFNLKRRKNEWNFR